MNKEISENLKEALENLQWCQTNVLYYEINNDKARELYKYIQELQHQLEEKNKCLLEIAKEEMVMVNWLKSKGMNFDNESWVNELEKILERGKNENTNN